MTDTLLLIDGDETVLRAVGTHFERLGAEVYRALTGSEGIETYDRTRPDVVVLNLDLPDRPGLAVLEQLRARGAAVILLTGNGDTAGAVRGLESGAETFLTKPVDVTHLAAAAARAAEKARLARQNAGLRARTLPPPDLESLGPSAAMRELARQIALLAAGEQTAVLLVGDSGGGKGWVARALHQLGPRSAGPFVDLRCGAMPATQLEQDLFGHEPGALPGALERRAGRLELAQGGTLLLHEIGELPAELQGKLLGVLERGVFRRLGGTRDLAVDLRLVAATSRELDRRVEQGRFREDLFQRLSAARLQIPALRRRSREDRLALVTHLLAGMGSELAGCPATCTPEALERLLAAPWPGNVRELRNVLERAMILARGRPAIAVEHLPADLREAGGGAGGTGGRHHAQTLAETERIQIERALRYHDGNRTRAALELGISRATLINKIKVYALDL